MKTSVPALLPLMPLLVACQPSVNADAGTSNGDGDGSGSESSSTQTSSGTDESGTDETGTETGGIEFCGLSEDGPDTPWFTLYEQHDELVSGDTMVLECGFQGFFMLSLDVAIGGFIPDSDAVPFQLTLDVEGFNIGAGGHFAVWDGEIFVGCCDYEDYGYDCYYLTTNFYLFPPDQIDDMAVLHELPATLTTTMLANGEPIEQVVDVQLWAVDDGSWEFCSYFDTHEPQLLPAGTSIPLD